MSKLEKIFFFAYGPYLGHFTLKPQPSPLLTCMTYIWDQGSNLLFAKHPDNRPCSRSANTSYILATSCDSILERCGIYHNLHLLYKLDRLSKTEAINSNPSLFQSSWPSFLGCSDHFHSFHLPRSDFASKGDQGSETT